MAKTVIYITVYTVIAKIEAKHPSAATPTGVDIPRCGPYRSVILTWQCTLSSVKFHSSL